MSEMNYLPEHKAAMDEILLVMPGVKGSKAFGYPAYRINGKIFAFVGGAGIAIKLPLERVQALIASHPHAKPFEVADGIIWREWLSIDRPNPADYHEDVALFEESAQFVLG